MAAKKPKLVSVKEASKRLGIGEYNIREMCEAKTIRAVNINPLGQNKVYRIPISEIERLGGDGEKK